MSLDVVAGTLKGLYFFVMTITFCSHQVQRGWWSVSKAFRLNGGSSYQLQAYRKVGGQFDPGVYY
jgi:hypothetical protein